MTEAGVAVLVIGTVIILVEAGLIARGGREYLTRAYPDAEQARNVAMLILTPGFLASCGALMLASTVGLGPDSGGPEVLARVGLVFLLAAAMHAGAIVILNREKAEVEELEAAEHPDQAPRLTVTRRPKPIPLLPEPLRDPPPDGL